MGAATTSRVDYWAWDNSPATWDASETTWDTASRKYYTTDIDETISVTDGRRISSAKSVRETVQVGDGCDRRAKTKRSWAESFAITDKRSAGYSAQYREGIRTREMFGKAMRYNKTHIESIAIDEEFSRRAVYAERVMREAIGVEDGLGKAVSTEKNEVIGRLSDVLLENANAVIDMVSFYSGVMDEATFAQRANTVQGYSTFKEFYVGDYEYQRALVKLSVTAEQMNSGIHLYNVIHNVDIPDTDDRGRVEITDTTAPTKVYFNKFYYHAPGVAVTLVGGSAGDGVVIPNVTSTEGQDEDGRYFEVELLKMSGERTQGTVIWVSKGY